MWINITTTKGCPLLLLLMFDIVRMVNGHGRLIKPPSRSSAWRYGFNTPENYNDNQLFCGGFAVQHDPETNKGRCGFCGDEYLAVDKTQEGNGKYNTKTVVGYYNAGQVIDVKVEITAQHLGWFQFQICDTESDDLTGTCVDGGGTNLLYLLKQPNGVARFDNGGNGINVARTYNVQLVLPAGLTCNRCVLQWRYHTGNSWGKCPDGTGALGCGPQEEFYGCADISISASGSAPTPSASSSTTTTSTTSTSTTASGSGPTPSTPSSTTTSSTTSTTTTSTTTTTGGNGHTNCKATLWYGATDAWCQANCDAGFCPQTHCTCDDTETSSLLECWAVGAFAGQAGMDDWCTMNCNHSPPFCPESYCICIP